MKHINPQFGRWEMDDAEIPNFHPTARPTLDTKREAEWKAICWHRGCYRNKFLHLRTLKGFRKKDFNRLEDKGNSTNEKEHRRYITSSSRIKRKKRLEKE